LFIDTDILSVGNPPPRRTGPVSVVVVLLQSEEEEEEEPWRRLALVTGIGMGMGIDRRGGGRGDSESGPVPRGDSRDVRVRTAVGEGVMSVALSASAGAMPRREAAAFSRRTEILCAGVGC
jgi:hypothetical protein